MKKNKYRLTNNPGHYLGSRWHFLEESLDKDDAYTIIGGFRERDLAIKMCKLLNEEEVNNEWFNLLQKTINYELFSHDHGL